ncbi:MAG: antibiotic biosynthesis monooxygenase [Rhodothermales bacterium]|nr:antibiotic biosynthesis monooxygenase [Rhodothermales bacterium]
MPDTVSWNLRLSVRDGQLEKVQTLMTEMVASTRQEEPGTEAYEWFISEDGSTCHIYERYVNSDAVIAHLNNFGANFAERFLGCLEPVTFTVYGDPSPTARGALDGFGANYFEWIGGFSR